MRRSYPLDTHKNQNCVCSQGPTVLSNKGAILGHFRHSTAIGGGILWILFFMFAHTKIDSNNQELGPRRVFWPLRYISTHRSVCHGSGPTILDNKCKKIRGKQHLFLLKLAQMHSRDENLRECCKMLERAVTRHHKKPHKAAWAQHTKPTTVAQNVPKSRENPEKISSFCLKWSASSHKEALKSLQSRITHGIT